MQHQEKTTQNTQKNDMENT